MRDGDEWIVNGQKVWTTLAHLARWGMLIARTDPDAPKHKGMTYFVIDMQAPGVEVRPLRQMTGEAEFNEVFMTDVRIPDAERLGDVGEGWRVSLTTLMNERVSIGGAIPPREGGIIRVAARRLAQRGAASGPARPQRDELMQLWIEAEVLRLTNIRASQLRSKGTPGPEGSVGKILSAEHNKAVTSFVVDLMGADGMLYTSYEMVRPTATMSWDCPQKAFLRMRANSIEGGTTEVMKNILGERVLGPARRRAHRQGAGLEGRAPLLDHSGAGARWVGGPATLGVDGEADVVDQHGVRRGGCEVDPRCRGVCSGGSGLAGHPEGIGVAVEQGGRRRASVVGGWGRQVVVGGCRRVREGGEDAGRHRPRTSSRPARSVTAAWTPTDPA